ncbi:MAG: hypothetical protein OER92_05455 [Alphaproteobacteria bacterium]|nr:hypothetical protein [Alphaproteobacteria bacterium]
MAVRDQTLAQRERAEYSKLTDSNAVQRPMSIHGRPMYCANAARHLFFWETR